jgi:hypothetical protein
MKSITEVIQGNEAFLRGRAENAILETGRASLLKKFEQQYDSLDLDGQLELVTNLLKNSNLFY